jgi:hypothetical protein
MLGSFVGTQLAQATYHFIPPDKKQRTPSLEEFSIYYTSLPPERKDLKPGYWHKNPYQMYGAIVTEPIMDMDGVDFQSAVGSMTISTTVEVLTMSGVDFQTEVGSIDLATIVRSECRIGHELTPFFLEKQAETNPRSIVKQFTYNNSVFTDRVVRFPSVSRTYKDVIAEGFTITLENASKIMNEVIEDRTTFRQEAEISYGYQFNPTHTDFGCIGKGDLIQATFEDNEISMVFKNKLDRLSEINISTDTTSLQGSTFTAATYNPADLTFDILTGNSYGAKLSSTTNASNPDIDYDSWLSWKNSLGSESIVVQAFFPYETNYVSALQNIAEMTDAAIYVEANNKLVFIRNITGVESFSAFVTDNDIISIEAVGDANDMCNEYTVPISFTVASNSVTGFRQTIRFENTASVNSFGKISKQPTQNLVWFVDSGSALNLAQRIVARRRQPEVALKITTPIKYLQQQLGDLIYVTHDALNLNQEPYTMIGQTVDIESQTMVMNLSVGHGLAVANFTVFELNDSEIGTLDNTVGKLA